MRRIIVCLIMMFALSSNIAYAGAGHSHDVAISQNQIIEKASGFVAKIVEKGKLDASWASVKPKKVEETRNHEWLVTFFNPAEENLEKQTLHMFLTLTGEYIAANFSGK